MGLPDVSTTQMGPLGARPALPHRCSAQQHPQLHREAVWAAQTVPRCSYIGSCGMRRTAGRSLVQPSWAWRHRLAGLRQSRPPGLCRTAASDDSRRSADKKGANVRDSEGKEEAFCPPGEPAQGGCCGFHSAVSTDANAWRITVSMASHSPLADRQCCPAADRFDASKDKPGSGVGTEGIKVPPPSAGTPSAYETNPLIGVGRGTDEPTSSSRPAVINTFHLVRPVAQASRSLVVPGRWRPPD